MNDAMLNKRDKKEKVYQVEMNKTPSDDQLAMMSRGDGVLSCYHAVYHVCCHAIMMYVPMRTLKEAAMYRCIDRLMD